MLRLGSQTRVFDAGIYSIYTYSEVYIWKIYESLTPISVSELWGRKKP